MIKFAGLLLLLLLAGCTMTGPGANEPRIEAMFRVSAEQEGVFTLSRPALVNELNGVYRVRGVSLQSRAALDESGNVIGGKSRVLVLEFTDLGGVSLLRTDDMDVSLRAELGPKGKVLRALLGRPSGAVHSGFGSWRNDTFVSGSYELIYDGPDVVVGRADLAFKKYQVKVNFRAPRR